MLINIIILIVVQLVNPKVMLWLSRCNNEKVLYSAKINVMREWMQEKIVL